MSVIAYIYVFLVLKGYFLEFAWQDMYMQQANTSHINFSWFTHFFYM